MAVRLRVKRSPEKKASVRAECIGRRMSPTRQLNAVTWTNFMRPPPSPWTIWPNVRGNRSDLQFFEPAPELARSLPTCQLLFQRIHLLGRLAPGKDLMPIMTKRLWQPVALKELMHLLNVANLDFLRATCLCDSENAPQYRQQAHLSIAIVVFQRKPRNILKYDISQGKALCAYCQLLS